MSDPVFVLLALFAAPFLGSFFGLLADRLPKDADVVFARSMCLACETPLKPWDMVPVLSYLALRGRCRACCAPIPRRTLLFELGTLALTAQAAFVFGGWLLLAAMVLAGALLAVTVIDAEHFIIPDALSLPLVLAGLVIAAAVPGLDVLTHALGAAVGYVLLALIAWGYERLRGMEGLGLGDAKLFAAAGAWCGWPALPFILLAASLGGLAAVLAMKLGGRAVGAQTAVPFGPFLAFGFWLVWLYGPGF